MVSIDIGCGQFKIKNFEGLDISSCEGVDRIGDARCLPFEDNTVEIIHTRRAIQHVKEDDKCFREIARVLKDNGIAVIILATPIGWLYYQVKNTLKFTRYKMYKTFHCYPKYALRKKLMTNGLKIIYFGGVRNDWLIVCMKEVSIKND